MKQYPLDNTFLVAAWLESLLYGCFLVTFVASVYVQVSFNKRQNTHNRVMFIYSGVMFAIATVHVAMNCFRLIRGFADSAAAPGGAVGYLAVLSRWDHIFKDTLYATQSIIGDSAGVYRCWILWNKDYRFVILPGLLLIGSTVSGYMVCGLYPTIDPNASIFNPVLLDWITAFYSIAVTQNIITTGLMALRLWQVEKQSARYRLGGGNFIPVIKILVESAALYLLIEILLLALYTVDHNAQYILLECVTPTAGFTFCVIAIRINLRAQKAPSGQSGGNSAATQTIGSIPMRPIVISRRVEESHHTDDIHIGYGKDGPGKDGPWTGP
ncbi:hypothetical protein DFH08DRAFT_484995 [Mycena albidolilacea]|uniref:Uncharacterized protein n=1 Tax=Mycena albidolilacea TaxID=1033008 RepID=A0AAD6Z622_9AGAR|nr:hypothetical protein DFH08DRAFT_484995 [Mycena albidolilacea]